VDDAVRMGGCQHVQQPVHHGQQLGHIHPAQAPSVRGERLTVEQLHDEERAAVRGRVDIAYFHRAGVHESIDSLRFLIEPRTQLGQARDLGVEDLDGISPPDLVHADVDSGHTARAQQPLDRPLPAQHCADSALQFLVVHIRYQVC
jgi:hypothetical protein